MRYGSFTQWRIDWRGRGMPQEGQFVGCVSASGRHTFARVRGVRVVRNRNPLPEGVECRYAVIVERIAGTLEPIDWWCHMYAKKRPSIDPSTDRFSPLK